jgi:hypothetical protein
VHVINPSNKQQATSVRDCFFSKKTKLIFLIFNYIFKMFSKLILKIILKNKKIKQKSTATIIQNDH